MSELAAIPAGVVVEQIDGFGGRRTGAEVALERAGVHLPLSHRALWQRARDVAESVLFVARAGGTPVAAMSAAIERSRALPRHRIYRVDRWTGSGAADLDDALLLSLADAVRRDFLSLRATLELFSFDVDARRRHAPLLRELGFVRARVPRMYSQTLAIDLTPPEEAIFASLDSKARRDIRVPAKKGFVIQPVLDPAHADRLTALRDEAFRRTGAIPDRLPWSRIIQLSAEHPAASRVVGMFDPRASGAEALVAFAWGCAHGSYATYDAGASARRPELGNIPLSYAPLWDLVAWAKRHTGATTFDLGGVTSGDAGDPRHGITEFKRYFSDSVVDVAEEWTLTAAPIRAAMARAISRGVRQASALAARA